MPRVTLLLLVVLALLVVACVPPVSLDPLFTEKHLTFDSALLGTWLVDKKGSLCTFERAGEKAYSLDCLVEGDRVTFDAYLLRLGPHTFLDTVPDDLHSDNTLALAHLVPGHIFSQVRLEGDELRLTQMSVEWLGKQLDAGTVKITHRRIDDGILLTASTAELQQFFGEQAGNAEAFSLTQEWTRVPPPADSGESATPDQE